MIMMIMMMILQYLRRISPVLGIKAVEIPISKHQSALGSPGVPIVPVLRNDHWLYISVFYSR